MKANLNKNSSCCLTKELGHQLELFSLFLLYFLFVYKKFVQFI